MATHHLYRNMNTRRALLETFRIFEDPYNLAQITPPWLRFQVVTPNAQMRTGAELEYTIQWLGLPMHWKTLITAYDPPHSFVDEQAEGPYRLWRHTHTFSATAEGTNIDDHVEYELPLGRLGEWAHTLLVKRQLEQIFDYRTKRLTELLR